MAALVLCVGAGSIASSPAGAASVPQAAYRAAATLSGPITTGQVIEPVSALAPNLAANGYVEQEFFASGTATAFRSTSEPSDGRWSIAPTTRASYRTRILVRRPSDPARFNGTVVVEWMNVSVAESAPEWDYLNPELMRDGYAYVAVSAQALGVDGGAALLGSSTAPPSPGLVGSEPARYGTLHHPGDRYALDMFAQIGAALRAPTGPVLGHLHPKHIVAVGESQSAFYLTTFADAVQPLTHTFDGIFIHSRGGGAAPLNGSLAANQGPQDVRIRTDLGVPVFMVETQTDVVELGYASAQQPDTRRIRTWEMAGTAHADSYIVGPFAAALGCTTPVNDGPQHVVVEAAFSAFDRWVDEGTPPPSPAPFRLSDTRPVALALDRHGNVIGGVRTPAVDVPVSTLSGSAPAGTNVVCSLFGSARPFSQSTLTSLYHDRKDYLSSYAASLAKAIRGGFILEADRAELLAQARLVRFSS
jgi:Alpha/beta hydrolase domain